MKPNAMVGLVIIAMGLAACGGRENGQPAEDGTPAAEEGGQPGVGGQGTPATMPDSPPPAGGRAMQPGQMMGGRSGGMMSGQMGAMHEGMMGGQGDTGAAPVAAAATATAQGGCLAINDEMVKQGRAIFSGPGLCHSCHGPDAKGTALAPDLTDDSWLDIDGSYASIAKLVTTGVPSPKQHPAPMPPKGGSSISADQVCQVAAYVYSLSHQ